MMLCYLGFSENKESAWRLGLFVQVQPLRLGIELCHGAVSEQEVWWPTAGFNSVLRLWGSDFPSLSFSVIIYEMEEIIVPPSQCDGWILNKLCHNAFTAMPGTSSVLHTFLSITMYKDNYHLYLGESKLLTTAINCEIFPSHWCPWWV